MANEILAFFKDILPIYILFTPAVVVLTSVLLIMMMITPSDSEAAKYKLYIKYAWIAWLALQLCPTFLVMCYSYAVNGNMLHW